jgi:hypothetical protein
MMFKTIEDVRGYEWKGNSVADDAAFRAIDNFVLNLQGYNHTLRDRAEAVGIYTSNGIGMYFQVSGSTDAAIVDNFINGFIESTGAHLPHINSNYQDIPEIDCLV